MNFTPKNLALILIGCIITISGCSKKEGPPTAPPTMLKGRISILNNSGVTIWVQGYIQTRGDRQVNVPLGVHLFPDQNYFLHDMIDGDHGQIFPAGDRVAVTYISEARDPDNPNQPLFRNTVDLTVNGTFIIQVKTGGEFGIYPG